MRDTQIHTLKNGIRIAHNRIASTKIVHCGIMLDIGSRDESPANQGIAHFWEHMAFKGTRKRKSFHILNRLESLGGELNAFTDKEKIMFFASVREEYAERAIELLTDITFHSIFPAGQIERERHVILEEMAMYYDDPEDSLQDEFDGIVFANHSLGMNILGEEKTVKAFRRREFQAFVKQHLDTRKVVLSVVGNLSFDTVVKLGEKHMNAIPKMTAFKKRKPFGTYTPREVTLHRDVKQARCAMGRTSYRYADEKRAPFFMLTNILGGPGMNSRLNMALREKYGFVYSVGAQLVSFTDTGLFVISFGTEPSQMKKSIAVVKQELKRLRDTPLGKNQLAGAREQIMGQIAMADENNVSFMMMMARSVLDRGRIPSLQEVFARVGDTTAADLTDLAQEMFDEDQLSCLIMQPASNGIH